MQKSITIHSTHGELTVDAVTGQVLDASQFSGDPPARIDVAELRARYGPAYAMRVASFDILDTGCWNTEGGYEPPCEEWRRETKENVLADIAALLKFDLHTDDVPDEVFWPATSDGLKRWIRRNLMEKRGAGSMDHLEGYEATLHTDRSAYGVELDITVPQNTAPVVVAQDVFGEKAERMQLLIYPATDEAGEVENAVSVRVNPDGSIAGVVVPSGIPVESWDAADVSVWMKGRDGQ